MFVPFSNFYLEGLPIERDRVEKHGSESGELIKVEGTVVVGVVASKFPEHDRQNPFKDHHVRSGCIFNGMIEKNSKCLEFYTRVNN